MCPECDTSRQEWEERDCEMDAEKGDCCPWSHAIKKKVWEKHPKKANYGYARVHEDYNRLVPT